MKVSEILNSKLVISFLIFFFLLGIIFAGNVIVNEGSLNIDNDLNSSGILYINSSSGNVGIGTATPNQKLHVVGNVNITGNLYVNDNLSFGTNGGIGRYDTGWIYRTDWTSVHLGSNTGLNVDSNVTHNLNAPLSNLLVRWFISSDGTDANSMEIPGVSYDTSGFQYGVTIYQVDSNNIKIQTGYNGIIYLADDGGVIGLGSATAFYYKVKVWKLG